MRRLKDRILERIVEKIKLSYHNGCRPVTIEDLESQLRDMPEMQDLNRQEREILIKSKLYKARRKTQKLDIPVRRLWRNRFVIGLKPVDIKDKEDRAMLEGDLDIDKKKRDGFIYALEERIDVAHAAGALTSRTVKRFQLIGGRGKKEKKLKR